MDSYKTLLIEDQGPVRVITLNQPKLFNPLDYISGPELAACLESTGRDPKVRAAVLTGAGKAFSGGGNVRLMKQMLDNGEDPAGYFQELAWVLNRTIIALRHMPKPIVSAVNGVAAGGGLGWSLGCDLVVAEASARFDPAYIRIAVNPDGGSSAILPRLIGHKRASSFFMLGQAIGAQKALEWGMVNEVVEDGGSLSRALEIARELAAGPAGALASTKALINQALFGDLETILQNERMEIARLSIQPEFKEGIDAFFEKRKPNFGG